MVSNRGFSTIEISQLFYLLNTIRTYVGNSAGLKMDVATSNFTALSENRPLMLPIRESI